jgi:hypothetical protein
MKVAPDFSGVSALDTWLRSADTGHSSSSVGPAAAVNAESTAVPSGRQIRDTAEDLLVLDLWNGAPPGQLHGARGAGGPEADASAQHWADHIFSPLR